jgi:hypothetical protein
VKWRRRLFNLLMAVSLALSVATAVLWFRCDSSASDELEFFWHRGYGIHSLDGKVFFSVFWSPQSTGPYRPQLDLRRDYHESAGYWSFMVMYKYGKPIGSFGLASVNLPPGDAIRPSVREVMVPQWFLVLMLLVLAARAIGRGVMRRRWVRRVRPLPRLRLRPAGDAAAVSGVRDRSGCGGLDRGRSKGSGT